MIIIYRHCDNVAISIYNQPTIYISCEAAESLMSGLKILTDDIKEVEFSESYSNTYSI